MGLSGEARHHLCRLEALLLLGLDRLPWYIILPPQVQLRLPPLRLLRHLRQANGSPRHQSLESTSET